MRTQRRGWSGWPSPGHPDMWSADRRWTHDPAVAVRPAGLATTPTRGTPWKLGGGAVAEPLPVWPPERSGVTRAQPQVLKEAAALVSIKEQQLTLEQRYELRCAKRRGFCCIDMLY